MNIANWYTNPNTWDLNVLYTMLMPNYDAQIMMTQNAVDVFSVGTILFNLPSPSCTSCPTEFVMPHAANTKIL